MSEAFADRFCGAIEETIADVKNQMDMFSFYDRYQQSTRDLSEQSANFLW